jgi:hypothetical protein
MITDDLMAAIVGSKTERSASCLVSRPRAVASAASLPAACW